MHRIRNSVKDIPISFFILTIPAPKWTEKIITSLHWAHTFFRSGWGEMTVIFMSSRSHSVSPQWLHLPTFLDFVNLGHLYLEDSELYTGLLAQFKVSIVITSLQTLKCTSADRISVNWTEDVKAFQITLHYSWLLKYPPTPPKLLRLVLL